jgi:hypothetical protein
MVVRGIANGRCEPRHNIAGLSLVCHLSQMTCSAAYRGAAPDWLENKKIIILFY